MAAESAHRHEEFSDENTGATDGGLAEDTPTAGAEQARKQRESNAASAAAWKARNAPRAKPARRTRLTADLPDQDADTLAEVARETGFNKVTTLIRAIRVLAELVRAENDGGELTIKYADGRRERLIIR